MKPKEIEQLNQNLNKLIDRLDKQNSLAKNFIISIIRGVGYFIGVTIVAGIIIYFLAQAAKSITQQSFFKNFINQETIEKFDLQENLNQESGQYDSVE